MHPDLLPPPAAARPASRSHSAARSLLSAAICAATAVAAVACIHFGPGGIKPVNQHAIPPLERDRRRLDARPLATLEFAPTRTDAGLVLLPTPAARPAMF